MLHLHRLEVDHLGLDRNNSFLSRMEKQFKNKAAVCEYGTGRDFVLQGETVLMSNMLKMPVEIKATILQNFLIKWFYLK